MNRTLARTFYPYGAHHPAVDDVFDSFPLGGDDQVETGVFGVTTRGSVCVPLLECSMQGSDDGQTWEVISPVKIYDIATALRLVGIQATLKTKRNAGNE